MPRNSGVILILSGESGSGKTTLCFKLYEKLKAAGVQVKGVTSPPVIENGKKTGIELVNLATGENRRLASLREGSKQGLFTIKWRFDAEVMDWGDKSLLTSIPCQVLILDELGPLEFERGIGLQNGMAAVDTRDYAVSLVVVRPSLVKAALSRWPDASVHNVTRELQSPILNEMFSFISTTIDTQ